jgi:hypothetical protein
LKRIFYCFLSLLLFWLSTHNSLKAQFSTSVSLSSLTPSTSAICDGSYPVMAIVTNNDPLQPTNGLVAVSYSLDGVMVSSAVTSGQLAAGASEPLLLGMFGNKPGKHRIAATVMYPDNTSPFISLVSNLTVQFNGTYSVGPNPSNHFASLKQAVDTLNAYGMCGSTIINCAAGHTETNSGILLNTLSTNATKTLTFNGNGSVITAGTGISTSTDGIIIVAGTNYVTFDGFTLHENAANLTSTTRMEWGFAILKRNGVSPLRGVQHLTIRNCTISLNKANNNSVGIYSNNHLPGSTAPLLPMITSDLNSYNKFYNNSISNVYNGILLMGSVDYPSYTLMESYNEIGVNGKNTISNFGVGTAPTSPAYGIYAGYQDFLKIANDSINGGSGHSLNLSGIHISGTVHYTELYNNVVSIYASSSNSNLFGIYNQCRTAGNGKISIYNNTVKNCKNITGNINSFNGIYVDGLYTGQINDTLEIFNNTIKNNRFNLGGSSYNYGINYDTYGNSGRSGTLLIHDNHITGNRNLTNGSSLSGIRIVADSVINTAGVWNNHISFDTVQGNYQGIIFQVTSSNGNNFCNNNVINNLVNTGSSSYGIYGINTTGQDVLVNGNSIHDLVGAGTLYGITSNLIKECSGNSIYNLTGGGCFGINASNGATSSLNIKFSKNKLYHFIATGSAGFSKGIDFTSSANNLVINIYNNEISDLAAPNYSTTFPQVIGIYATSNYSSNINLHYNTVYLNTSGLGANFASCGMYLNSTAVTSNTPTFLVKNNLIVNTSLPSGAGKTSALGLNLTNISFYSVYSDYNCFSAGNPGPMNLLVNNYKTGAAYPTLSQLQTGLSPREQHSFYENPPFVNTTTSPFDLHLLNSTVTLCESGGFRILTPIAITDDHDGMIRWGETGYLGNGDAPDVGAYEGDYMAVLHVNLGNDTTICGNQPFILNAGPGNSYVWSTGEITQTIGVTATGTYSVTVTGGGNQTAYGSINITVLPNLPVSVSIIHSADSICAGTTIAFTAVAVNGGISPTYQWKVNGVNAGTGNALFTYAPVNNDLISCTLTSGLTGCISGNPATSNTLSMFVYPNITASVSISANQTTICPNTPVTFSTSTVNGGNPVYEWKKNGVTIPGETDPVYISSTLNNGDVVNCVMTSSSGPCLTGSPAISNSITITVIQPPSCAGITGPSSACEGSVQNYSISCNNANGYTWSLTGNGTILNPGTGATVNVNVGTFSGQVCVTPFGNCATLNPICISVAVNPLPLAGFSIDDSNLPIVGFTSTSLYANIFDWDFGDGNTSSLANPIHTYQANGTYTITLIVYNGCGSDTITNSISILHVGLDDLPPAELITVTPNPANDKIIIKATNIHEAQIDFYNIQGQLLSRYILRDSQEEFDISGLPAGLYFLHQRSASGNRVVKLVKN